MRFMLIWRVAMAVGVLVGCTKHNPIQCDGDHDCGDPNKPFCDIDGSVDGEPNTCIPGACTPGATLSCNDGIMRVCNQLGSSYEQETCALGCADETRCKDIDPSNGFASMLDEAPMGPDVVLIDGDIVDVETGIVRNDSQPRLMIPLTRVAAPTNGVPISVFAVHSLAVSGTVGIGTVGASTATAFVSSGSIDIEGVLVVSSGGFDGTSLNCRGEEGSISGTDIQGGWGGGNATDGAVGGGVTHIRGGGYGFPNPALVPLRGGCFGGAGVASGPGPGGGALQLSSSTSVVVGSNARILANAFAQGGGETGSGSGGSSGGGILLEAPTVTIGTSAVLSANGVGGAAGDGTPATSPRDGSPSRGGVCTVVGVICSNGGDGNTADGPPGMGGNDPQPTLTDFSLHYGGGGGAAGYIRINTLDGSVDHPGATISPRETVGTIMLR